MSAVIQEVPKPLRLDLGCGKNKREGFTGVDSRQFEGVDIVCDLVERRTSHSVANLLDKYPEPIFQDRSKYKPWPWEDNSVEEVHSSHFIEHLTAPERIHFVNELHRVLKPAGKATLITPHWSSCRAYGDLTHQWPPVSEFWFYYLSKAWREQNAPHNDGYTCDFEATWGYGMHPQLIPRNAEYQQHAMQFFKEAVQDLHASLIKK